MFEKKETPEIKPEAPKAEVKPETAKAEGVKVTKGGISKYVDPSQAANYKANGWKTA
jgi:hypothetical protein